MKDVGLNRIRTSFPGQIKHHQALGCRSISDAQREYSNRSTSWFWFCAAGLLWTSEPGGSVGPAGALVLKCLWWVLGIISGMVSNWTGAELNLEAGMFGGFGSGSDGPSARTAGVSSSSVAVLYRPSACWTLCLVFGFQAPPCSDRSGPSDLSALALLAVLIGMNGVR